MYLRYISLYMDYDSGYKDPFRDNFNLNSRFINHYLSMQVRKLKLETDGTFNMISVIPSIDFKDSFKIAGEKALRVRIEFIKDAYERMSQLEKYNYYLRLLEEGYKICDQYKKVHLTQLLNLHQAFRNGGFENEWLHKKRKFKEYGIEVKLNCYFTTIDFQLKILVYDIKSKKELVSGTVIRTLPDELCFAHFFKDIIIKDNELIITEFQNRPKFKFLLSDILKGKFSFVTTKEGVEYKPYLR